MIRGMSRAVHSNVQLHLVYFYSLLGSVTAVISFLYVFFVFTRAKFWQSLMRVIHISSTVLKAQPGLVKSCDFTVNFSADGAFPPVYSVIFVICCCSCEAGMLMNRSVL